jgi:hypothetical protein
MHDNGGQITLAAVFYRATPIAQEASCHRRSRIVRRAS